MSATTQTINQLKDSPLSTIDSNVIQTKLYHLVDSHYVEAGINQELKSLLDLSQFGLTEPSKVENFLNNTPQGKMIIALISEEEALEEALLEQQYEHNIEQQQQEDNFKQFMIYEAAKTIDALKVHTAEVNHQAELHSEQLDAMNSSTSTVDPILMTHINGLNETLDNLIDANNYHNYLTNQKRSLEQQDSKLSQVLTFYKADKDLLQLKALLSINDPDTLAIKKNILKIKLNKKRHLLQNELLEASQNFANEDLSAASAFLLENLLLLNSLELAPLQDNLKTANTIEDMHAYLAKLQQLEVATPSELLDHQTALQSISDNSDETNVFIQLQKFKKMLKVQYTPRELINAKGAVLENQADISAAFYTKPQNINAFFTHQTLFFVDNNLFEDTVLSHNNLHYLVTNEARIEEHMGELYLLKPGQEFNTLTNEEKENASKEANKAKVLAFNAKELAKQYKLTYTDNHAEILDIENKLIQCEENQCQLKLKVKQKRQEIASYQAPTKEKTLSPKSLTLKPASPKFVPQNKFDIRLEVEKLTKEMQQDFTNKTQYDNQTMHQVNQRVLTNLQNLPPETLSLVLTKYRGVLPVVSHVEQNSLSLTPSKTYSPLELAKQQVELNRLFKDIGQSLQAQATAKLAPELTPMPANTLPNEFNPRATPVMAG